MWLGRRAAEVGGELDALRLAAGERVRRLPEREVAEPHVLQHDQLVRDPLLVSEEVDGLVDGHVESMSSTFLPVPADFEHVLLEALAAARLALEVEVGEELHLDLDHAVALADLAAPAGDVERERAGLVAAHLRLVRAPRGARGSRRTP